MKIILLCLKPFDRAIIDTGSLLVVLGLSLIPDLLRPKNEEQIANNKTMNHFYELETIKVLDREAVGEKAIALHQLLQKRYQVPPTIVIGSQVFTALLNQDQGLSFFAQSSLTFNDYHTLQQTAQSLEKKVTTPDLGASRWYHQLYQKIANWKRKTLILRPSLVSPFPEELATSLLESHCCLCEKKELELGVKQVWKSFCHAHNLYYWQQQKITLEKLGLAVIIQPIENAIASGILEKNTNKWLIQSVRGLGHSLARGEVLPETYEINPLTKNVDAHQLGYQTRIYNLDPLLKITSPNKQEAERAILTSEQLSQLTDLATSLEEMTEQNFDCEWVFFSEMGETTSSQLYLTQFSVKEDSPVKVKIEKTSSPHLIVSGIGAASGQVAGRVYCLDKDQKTSFPSGGILMTKNITLASLSLLKLAAGLITEEGGMTSHGAILARELKIPAVVGAKGVFERLKEGEMVTVDGDRGEVFQAFYGGEMTGKTPVSESRETPLLATEVMVNVSQSDRAIELAQYPVDGVGLLRSDLMLLELLQEQSLSTWLTPNYRNDFIEELANLIGEFVKAFFPRPVFYRSTDWLSFQEKETSLLGERGTYNYLKNSDFFSVQMFALRHLQEQGYDNINLILPFVRSVEEVAFCQTLVREIGLEKSCQLWMMAEVPSVVYLLRDYIKAGIQGIAIGTNDLTQLCLGVDREQGAFREKYNESHPAMLAILKELIEKANAAGLPCSICGQGSVLYPELVKQLIHWGITSISVEESGIKTVSRMIARSEKQLLLEAARQKLSTRLT